jgi:predicted PurR-regulated permease PerM
VTGNTKWSPATKRGAAIVCALVALLVLYLAQPLIPFIIAAGVITFLLDPIITFLVCRVRLPRWVAVLLAYLALLVCLALALFYGVPALIDAIRELIWYVPGLLNQAVVWLRGWLTSIRYIKFLDFSADLSPIVDPALEALAGAVPSRMLPSPARLLDSVPSAFELARGFATAVLGTVVSAILAFLLTLIYSIYLSVDLPKIGRAVMDVIPPAYRQEAAQLGSAIRQVWIAYLRGQLVLAIVIGVVVGLGTAALGLPGAALLGALAGALEVLPTIGPVAAAVPAIILALIRGSTVLPVSNFVFALLVALFYWLVQQLENNIIVPRIIGDAIKVHPILVMAAVVIGASVGGVFGALMAAPVLATGRVLAHYIYCKMLDLPPFPMIVEAPTAPVRRTGWKQWLGAVRSRLAARRRPAQPVAVPGDISGHPDD